MQTVWKGALSFGLVNVPVSLVRVTRRSRVSFRQLHATDQGRVRNERRCSTCGKALPASEIAKGAEVGKDLYVVVTDEELERVEPASSRALAIREFVPLDAIDPVYHDQSYALAPASGGERAYALLHDALARRREAGVGKLVLRGREHLVAVRAGDRLLFADLLRFADEVRDLGEVERRVAAESPEPEEAELADVLLERLHRDWNPSKYRDEHEERVRDLIAAKARGEAFVAPRAEPGAPALDLLTALRETLRLEERRQAGEEGA